MSVPASVQRTASCRMAAVKTLSVERLRWTNIQFLINPDVDPKLFETPPSGVTQADAWKKFLRKDPAKH